MSLSKVNKQGFSEIVSKAEVVVADFYAVGCPPCQFFASIFKKAAEARPDLEFVKLDIDDNDALAERYDVEFTPTVVLLKGGRKVATYEGSFNSLEQFLAWLNRKLK